MLIPARMARRPRACAMLAGLAPLLATVAVAAGVAIAAVAAGAQTAPARDYAVRLNRPAAAGEKRLAVGWLSSDDRLSGTRDGQPSDQRQTSTIRYVVATEIQEVGSKGNALRATLTVRRLVKESGGVSLELAKPGAVITARLAGRERLFELLGARLAPDLQQALAAAVPLRADDEPTDDDRFGTEQRRRVGESWTANAALIASSGPASVTFDPRNVTGTVTLASIKPVNGQPCMEVRWKLEARHGSWKPGSLPPGFAATNSSMSVTGSLLVPVDTALPPAGRDTSITGVADVSGESVGGSASSLHHELRQVVHVELSKVP
jgi:hypothetical protein